tara:strand:- start:482 stop:631 length:150 start_codon:yes stop_codon:yes gene_type:complete
MTEEVKTMYYYIEHLDAMQKIRKDTPNDYTFGAKIREYLIKIDKQIKTK